MKRFVVTVDCYALDKTKSISRVFILDAQNREDAERLARIHASSTAAPIAWEFFIAATIDEIERFPYEIKVRV